MKSSTAVIALFVVLACFSIPSTARSLTSTGFFTDIMIEGLQAGPAKDPQAGVSTEDECREYCMDTTGCVAWSFNTGENTTQCRIFKCVNARQPNGDWDSEIITDKSCDEHP